VVNVQTLMRCVLAVALMLSGLRGQVPQHATALRERLAAIELQVTVDGDIAGAEAALAELERACAGTEMEAVLAAPEAQALRGRIVAAIAAARSPDRVSLPQVVADAIVAQDEITLETLGHEAAVALRESLAVPTPPLADIDDTLRFDWLLRLDESEAWAFLGSGTATAAFEAENGPSLAWSIRKWGLRWIIRDGRAPTLERPEWLDVIARLLRTSSAVEAFGDRAFGTGSLVGLLGSVAQHDAFSPPLVDAVSTLLANMDGYAVLSVLQSPGGGWAPSRQALLERLVADPREAVRRQAAEQLVQAEVSAGLRSRVHDSSSAVRLSLVKSMGKRQRQVARWSERSDDPELVWEELEPPADAEAGRLLAMLAADPDPAVREAVVRVLASEPTAVDVDVYRQLAADSDALVRKALAVVNLADANLQAEVLSLLAGDSVQQVTDAVDQRLERIDGTASTAWLAPVLRARLENGSAPLRWLPQELLRAPAARAELTDMLLRTGDELLLSVLGDSILSKDRMGRATKVGNSSMLKDWVTLPGVEMARLFPLLRRISPLLPPELAFIASDGKVDASVPAALDSLVADTTLPLADRLAACAITLHDPTPERCARLLALLSDPSLSQGTDFVEQDRTLVAAAIRSVPLERRNAVIRDILQSVALRDDLALDIASRFDPSAPQATEVVPLVLDRWLEWGGSPLYFMESAFQVVGRTPELASEDLMRRALRSPAAYGASAVAAMGRLRDPRFLDVLRECLDPTWYRGDGPGLSIAAINALQGYMNDEAAAILLDAAANSPSSSVRAKALEAVEAIGRYRDALAAWQRRTASGSTRDAAVAKLAASVADKQGMEDVRAEAVRALGVLQAVEQLPLIIEALTDDSRHVREAAREALDRINAAVPAPAPARPKPPAEPEPDTEPDQP
jgi:hypothetical protein